MANKEILVTDIGTLGVKEVEMTMSMRERGDIKGALIKTKEDSEISLK